MADERWADPWKGSYALEILGRRTAAGRPALHRRLAGFGIVRPLERHPPTRDWLSTYGPETPEIAEMWRRTVALIEALEAAVRADGAELVVFYVPARFELWEDDWRLTRSRWQLTDPAYESDRVFRRLYEACASRGIPFVDPRDALAEALDRGTSPYLERDPHWNALGHDIAAQVLFEHVAARSCQ
jgi:hypothetical protein